MVKLKKRVRLWNWLTNKFQLVIRNEENFEEKTTINFNYAKAFLTFFTFFGFMLILSLFLAKFVLSQWYDPQYEERKLRREIRDIAVKIDSLEEGLFLRDQKLNAFKIMLEGGKVMDEHGHEKEAIISKIEETGVEDISDIDKKFREEFEKDNLENVPNDGFNPKIMDKTLFSPVDAFEISQKFSPSKGHYGLDLVAKPKSPVKSISEGTIVSAQWTQEDGNVIIIQHENELISVYKHNSVLLKKVGNFVKSGDVIAIMGNSGEGSSGPHLHVELWLQGKPVNPEYYLSL